MAAANKEKNGFLIMKKEDYNMTHQLEHVNLLKTLHTKGTPLVLINIWDAGSAKIAQEAGLKAIATSCCDE